MPGPLLVTVGAGCGALKTTLWPSWPWPLMAGLFTAKLCPVNHKTLNFPRTKLKSDLALEFGLWLYRSTANSTD